MHGGIWMKMFIPHEERKRLGHVQSILSRDEMHCRILIWINSMNQCLFSGTLKNLLNGISVLFIFSLRPGPWASSAPFT